VKPEKPYQLSHQERLAQHIESTVVRIHGGPERISPDRASRLLPPLENRRAAILADIERLSSLADYAATGRDARYSPRLAPVYRAQVADLQKELGQVERRRDACLRALNERSPAPRDEWDH
jgi:hypothetical protein